MIRDFRHKGLAQFWQTGALAGVPPKLANRVRQRLEVLDAARDLRQLASLPTLRLHTLKGTRAGRWAIDVNGPWRITFEWRDGDAHGVDLEQYH